MMFSGVAALLVYLAGRRDAARDPRLTGLALALLAVFPALAWVLPKFAVLPARAGVGMEAGFSWMGPALGIWAAGFGMVMLRLCIAAGVLAGWRGRSRLIDHVGRIEIRELRGLKGPVAAGVFRQVVFVPEAWNDWPERIQRIVLDHETAHHHRRDPLWRWVAEIAFAVNWFNPLVWWMVRRLTIQCEYACDSAVIRKGVSARDYATLLCDLAEAPAFRGPALAMAERASLENRVGRLMSMRKPPGVVVIPLMIAVALAAAFAFASISLKSVAVERFSPEEVRMRWAADPFPGGN